MSNRRSVGRSVCSPRLWEREWLVFSTIWLSFSCSFVSRNWYSKSSLINPFHLLLNSSRLSNSCNVTTNDDNGLFEIVFAYPDAAEGKEMQCLRKLSLMGRVSRLELGVQVRRKDDETFLIEVNLRADLFWTECIQRRLESWRERADSALKINCPHSLSTVDWRTIETFVNCSMNKWNEHPNLASSSALRSSNSASSSSSHSAMHCCSRVDLRKSFLNWQLSYYADIDPALSIEREDLILQDTIAQLMVTDRAEFIPCLAFEARRGEARLEDPQESVSVMDRLAREWSMSTFSLNISPFEVFTTLLPGKLCLLIECKRETGILEPSVNERWNRTTTFSRVVCLARRRTEHWCRWDQQTDLAVLRLYTFMSCWWTSSKFIKGDWQSHSHHRDREERFFPRPASGKSNRPHRYHWFILSNTDRSFSIWKNLPIEWKGKWKLRIYFCDLSLVHKCENVVVRHPSRGDRWRREQRSTRTEWKWRWLSDRRDLLCFAQADSNHIVKDKQCVQGNAFIETRLFES